MRRFIENHDGKELDIVIIGGGITGAAVAYEAASRGLSVALVEKHDFGWATSAATSKLIHGGLRYLKNMEIALVRESLKERKTLGNIAPNLVYPIPFVIPTYSDWKQLKKISLRVGLTLYDRLAIGRKRTWDRSKQIPAHRVMRREEIVREEPLVRTHGLGHGLVFYDSQSLSPERLTLAFVRSAVQHGALVSNYASVEDLFVEGDAVKGARVVDRLTGDRLELRAGITLNCTGPWADMVTALTGKKEVQHRIRRSEGIHIITRRLVNKYSVGLFTARGTHFFLCPWRGHTLIGTTDTEYLGSPDDYRVTGESVKRFLSDVNETFGGGDLGLGDVKFAYGGLRPLVEDQTEGTYSSSRRYEIFDHSREGLSGLVTIEGGKYTTSRNLAQKVITRVSMELGRKIGESVSARKHLAGCEIDDMESFVEHTKRQHRDVDAATIEHLARSYGTEHGAVLELGRGDPELMRPVSPEGEILAEVAYAVEREMARTLTDVFFRRTGLGTLGHPGDQVIARAADVAGVRLGWSDERKQEEIAKLKARFELG